MVCTLDKKGQIGKMITAFPVILAILLLVSGFVIFTEFIKKNNVGFNKEAVSIGDNGFLFSTISIKYNDDKVNDMRALDAVNNALAEISNGGKSFSGGSFQNSFNPLVTKNKGCLLILFRGPKTLYDVASKYFLDGSRSTVIPFATDREIESYANNLGVFTITEKTKVNTFDREISYYYGGCIK